MNRRERLLNRFRAGAAHMSADERRALRRALEQAQRLRFGSARMVDCVAAIGAARGRAVARRESDRRTDTARRRTVGARVPLAFYERVVACAGREKISLYRFTLNALERECARVEALAQL